MPSKLTFIADKQDDVSGRPSEDASDSKEGPSNGHEALLHRLKRMFRLDAQAAKAWRTEAKEDYQFAAGDHWNEEDKNHLKDLMRPIITFNRILPIVNSISGHEISNRQEVRYIPREEGDTKPNELLTEAARWFRDQAEADDEDSDAFLNNAICGMGWTETTLDYENEEDGEPVVESLDPMEMLWDSNARKKNLTDAERIWRVRKLALGRAKELFPGASTVELNATWAENDLGDKASPTDQRSAMLYQDTTGEEDKSNDDDTYVTLVHVEWKTKVNVFTVADPTSGKKVELNETEYKKLQKRAKEVGIPVFSTKRQKTQVKQAFLGGTVLQYSDGLCGDHFRYACVTGYRDAVKGQFFGIVRSMKDPQRWANKWLSQTLDLMNTQVKGGVIFEEDAVDDVKEFQRTWARADIPTVVKRGALTNPNGKKIENKPVAQFPASFFQLMEFAINSIRDVTGISVEMLGLREADQPASLEFQRRQAGMTILAPLFQNLKRYRHDQGRVMLYLIQNYLTDGRLIRILGDSPDTAKYLPLIRQADVKYDIIVDDMPTSPNNKEMIWAMIGERIWDLPPPIQMALLKYSPFPSTVVEEVKKAANEMSQSPQAQLQQQMLQLEAALNQATAQLKQAQTGKTVAETQQIQQQTQMGGEGADPANMVKAQGELQIKAAELQQKGEQSKQELELKKQEVGAKMQMEQQKNAANMQMEQQKFGADMQMKQQDMSLKAMFQNKQHELDQQRMHADVSMQHEQMQNDSSLAREQMNTDTSLRRDEMKNDSSMARAKMQSDSKIKTQQVQGQQKTAIATAKINAAAKPKPKPGNK